MANYLSAQAVAARLGINVRTVYYWLDRSRFTRDDWTEENNTALVADGTLRKGHLPQPVRPHCGTCGTTNPRLMIRNRSRKSGWAAECRSCAAARMRRARAE